MAQLDQTRIDAGGPVVELRQVGKSYAGIRALDGVSVRIEPGKIHALVGENGAGKSTLGKIIGGIVTPTDGEVLIRGRPAVLRSPRQAIAAGVAVMQQEPALVGPLTVAENVVLGDEPARRGLLRRAELRRRFDELLERVPLGLDADTVAEDLSIADQQKVEILRALARDARVIVMDEPTSSLGQEETDLLHGLVRTLCAEGRAIVYVSHFLEEITALADRFTVLRNGRHVETFDRAEASVERLVTGMLGSAATLDMPLKVAPPAGAPVQLSVRGLTRGMAVRDVDLDVRAGEIVGLAGLVGSGRSEVLRMIFGADRPDAGTVTVAGRPVPPDSPRRAIEAGIGFVPEDRAREGLLLDLSQRLNVTLPHIKSFGRAGLPDLGAERRVVGDKLQDLRVHPLAPERDARSLSGGNQQKVLFAKWLLGKPQVLLLDEPTRGVDIGAKWAIYQLIASLAEEGMAILLVSSEAEEVIGLAHRVLVMRRGRVTATFEGADIDLGAVKHAALGVEMANGGAKA